MNIVKSVKDKNIIRDIKKILINLIIIFVWGKSMCFANQENKFSFIPQKGSLIFGKIKHAKEITKNNWVLTLNEVEVLLGELKKKEVDVNFMTGLGGILISLDKDIEGKNALAVVVETKDDAFFIPKVNIPLFPNGKSLFIFSDKNISMIAEIRNIIKIYNIESKEERLRELNKIVSDKKTSKQIKKFAEKEIKYLISKQKLENKSKMEGKSIRTK